MKKLVLICTLFFGLIANAAVTINSLSASNVSVRTATLSFFINPGCGNGAMITYDYSTSSAFTVGTTITATYMQYGTGGTKVVEISNLLPNTTYYWRVSGSNTCTSTTTSVNGFQFTTKVTDKPAIQAVVATTPVNYGGTIAYSLYANGSNTTSVINYGPSATSLTTQITAATTTTIGGGSYPITGLANNTTYFYQIVATNTLGATSSDVKNFTTTNVQPPIVTNGTISTTHNFASLNYAIQNNMGGNVNTVIRYGSSASNLTSQTAGYSGTATFNTSQHVATLINLTPNTTYFYQIECTNASTIAQTTVASFTTNAAPTTANTTGLLAHYAFENNSNSHNNTHNTIYAYKLVYNILDFFLLLLD